ncbi:TPA: helix-turn-helix domain-containing protein [Enterococcus faecium]|jgi:transcriptional regulator with XRE-family HTH domain
MEEKDWEIKSFPDSEVELIQKNLGQKIKIGRIKKGVTIIDLSSISGMTESYLSNVENGKIKAPSLRSYLKICYALNINPIEFFSNIPTMPPFDSPDNKYIS